MVRPRPLPPSRPTLPNTFDGLAIATESGRCSHRQQSNGSGQQSNGSRQHRAAFRKRMGRGRGQEEGGARVRGERAGGGGGVERVAKKRGGTPPHLTMPPPPPDGCDDEAPHHTPRPTLRAGGRVRTRCGGWTRHPGGKQRCVRRPWPPPPPPATPCGASGGPALDNATRSGPVPRPSARRHRGCHRKLLGLWE